MWMLKPRCVLRHDLTRKLFIHRTLIINILKQKTLSRRDELLRVCLLLAKRLVECSYAANDADSHENQGNNRPDDTPASRRATVSLRKDAGIRSIHLAKDQIVTLYWLAHRPCWIVMEYK